MTKKSFINHPALKFIGSAHTKEDVAEGTEKAATGSTTTPPVATPSTPPPTVKPGSPETKSRRVQILIQPGLHDRAKADAQAHGVSFNEYLHRALQHYIPITK